MTWNFEIISDKFNVWGLFAKFMDSSYYSKSEPYECVVMVSFSKYLPWQAMHFLQCSTHFSKMCCRPSITSEFLALELPFHGWKSPEIAMGKIWIEFCIQLGKSGSVKPHYNICHPVQISPHWFLGFSNHEKGAWRQDMSKWSVVCGMFSRSRWSIVRSASLAEGGTSKKRVSPLLHEVLSQSNKVRPWTLQTALIVTFHSSRNYTETCH
jgi:hypothetical protein